MTDNSEASVLAQLGYGGPQWGLPSATATVSATAAMVCVVALSLQEQQVE